MLQIWRRHFVTVTGRQVRPHSHHPRQNKATLGARMINSQGSTQMFALDRFDRIEGSCGRV